MYIDLLSYLCIVFFFKQKTAYEMRISDWSSDVCSSDLHNTVQKDSILRLMKNTSDKKNYRRLLAVIQKSNGRTFEDIAKEHGVSIRTVQRWISAYLQDRKSVVQGKSVSVRVDIGGRRIIKKKNNI